MKGIEQFDFDVTLIFAVLNGRVSAAINRRLVMDFKAEGIDISPEQLTVLSLLWKKDRVTQQELCNVTFKDKPNMTRLIDSLERKGLAKRTIDENDKRNNLIILTSEGKAIEEKAFLVANTTMRKALVNVTPQELAIGQDLLKKIFSNMQEKPNKEE
jgi:DNA-binding MarR family transcriptional regulator